MKLLTAFINALFPPPEVKPADLATLTTVRGGSGIAIYRAVNRYAGFVASIDGGSERNDLVLNEIGRWDLVNTKRLPLDKEATKKVTGTFATLEEALPQLRAASEELRGRYGGSANAMAGLNYAEDNGPDSLAAAELALRTKNSPPPQPSQP